MNIKISNREVEVIELISMGYTDKEIGKRLFISHYTVGDHRRTVKIKLDCPNAPSIVRKAFEMGILPLIKNEISSFGSFIAQDSK
ncbi:MAG: LuxR C-terminal-related transcriptional regulator [Saprospiraceae bacterium]